MSAKMTINDSLWKKLDKARMASAMTKAVRDTMREVSETSAKKAPKKTGNLRRSHSYDTNVSGGIITGRVKNSANYWVYVNFGTSRMKKGGRHFLEHAVNTVNPPQAIKTKFKEYYGGDGS